MPLAFVVLERNCKECGITMERPKGSKYCLSCAKKRQENPEYARQFRLCKTCNRYFTSKPKNCKDPNHLEKFSVYLNYTKLGRKGVLRVTPNMRICENCGEEYSRKITTKLTKYCEKCARYKQRISRINSSICKSCGRSGSMRPRPKCLNPRHLLLKIPIRLYQREIGKTKKRTRLLKKYGLNEDQFKQFLEKQENKCCLCMREFHAEIRPARIDHDHKTGFVRGLLCIPCNRILAYIEDKLWLSRAFAYLSSARVPLQEQIPSQEMIFRS